MYIKYFALESFIILKYKMVDYHFEEKNGRESLDVNVS